MTHPPANRVQLDELSTMPVGEIAELPVLQLALLQDEAAARLEAARRLQDRLHGAMTIRYSNLAAQMRAEAGKETGIVRFRDGDVTVVAELPKKVDWDQEKLAELARTIAAGGDNPSDYVAIRYRVSERAFHAWPERIRRAFAAARSVSTGRQTFTLSLGESR